MVSLPVCNIGGGGHANKAIRVGANKDIIVGSDAAWSSGEMVCIGKDEKVMYLSMPLAQRLFLVMQNNDF